MIILLFIFIFIYLIVILLSKKPRYKPIQYQNIVYVTSCKKSMYDLYGKQLIHDLSKSISQNEKLIVCTEDFSIPDMHNVHQYDISNYHWLKTWLKNNNDIIPPEFGGSCIQNLPYFNKNTSKWMRKVAAIRYAKMNFDFDILIWIDVDSKLKKPIDNYIINKSFSDASVFYHQGFVRNYVTDMGIETGVVGFYGDQGKKVLSEWFKEYDNFNFRKLKRWDDGYVFKHVIKNTNVQCKDMTSMFSRGSEPLRDSEWGKYIKHMKGKHKTNNLYK